MTREESITMLYGIRADNLNLNDVYTNDKFDALTIAIKALEQDDRQPTVKAIPLEKLEHIKNRIIESSIIDDDEKYVDNGNLIIETRTVLQIIDKALKEQSE